MRTLGLIAIGGVGIGIASLSLAYALGGRDLHRLPFDLAASGSCGEVAKGSPSVRRLAWDNGDAIEISLPGTVTFRGGQGSEVIVRGSPDLVAHVEVRGRRLVLDGPIAPPSISASGERLRIFFERTCECQRRFLKKARNSAPASASAIPG